MKTLVTGATGFIGSHLVPALLDQGHEVVATDVVKEPHWIASRPDVPYVRVDLGSDVEVRDLMSTVRPDNVVHLAGLLAEACEAEPQLGFRVNVMATLSLLEACVADRITRFVMTSSPAVFGRGLAEPVADEAAKLPETVYGQTKLACEHMLDWYRRTHGLSVGAVRFPWVYGPGRTTGLTAQYSSFLFDAIARGEEAVVANADQSGNWLYVKDAVKSLFLMLETCVHSRVAYNVVGGVHSVGDAMNIARELFPDARIRIRKSARDPYPYPSSFDDSRAREELGWRPEYSIRRGMKEHVETVRRSLEVA